MTDYERRLLKEAEANTVRLRAALQALVTAGRQLGHDSQCCGGQGPDAECSSECGWRPFELVLEMADKEINR